MLYLYFVSKSCLFKRWCLSSSVYGQCFVVNAIGYRFVFCFIFSLKYLKSSKTMLTQQKILLVVERWNSWIKYSVIHTMYASEDLHIC